VSPTPKKAPKLNAGQYAKMIKKCLAAAEQVNKLTAKIKEQAEEIATLKDVSASQDQARRTKETEHSDEMLAVMAEIRVIKSMVKGSP